MTDQSRRKFFRFPLLAAIADPWNELSPKSKMTFSRNVPGLGDRIIPPAGALTVSVDGIDYDIYLFDKREWHG